VLLSWHEPSRRLLAVGAGGRVLLVTVPLGGGMEQLQFDLDQPSTPGAAVSPASELRQCCVSAVCAASVLA
jgi:hypothetical protein